MKQYTCTSLTGFKDHLPSKTARLPLRYTEVSREVAVHEQFAQKTAQYGTFVSFENQKSFLDSVSIDVSNDGKLVTLTPVLFSNQLGIDLQKILLQLPNKVLSNCFSVSTHNNDDVDLDLVIDLLDERLLFVTVLVNLKDFVVGQGNDYSLSEFRHWGNISVPYSFELRSAPFYFKSVDPLNCYVSLKDGGLLHFRRPLPLQDFDVYNFSDHSKGSLSLFGLFSKKSVENTSVVDAAVFGNTLVALTVDKYIKFFDIDSHTLVNSIKVSADETLLTATSQKFLQVIEKEGKHYVFFHDTSSADISGNFTFHVWLVEDFHSVQTKSFSVKFPQTSDEALKTWFVQDFDIKFHSQIQLHILWKSNFSSLVTHYSVDASSLNVTDEGLSDIQRDTEYLQVFSQKYYQNQVLNSGVYNDLILDTSMNILRGRLGLPKALGNDNLYVEETISKLREKGDDKPWFILNSLCEEYLKLGKEVLSLSVKGDNVLVLQINGLGIYRPLSLPESFVADKNDSFNGVLQAISEKLSDKTIQKVYEYVLSLEKLSGTELVYISDTLLGSKLDINIDEVTEVLNNYDNINEKLNSLIDEQNIDNVGYETNISILTRVFLVASFRDIITTHKDLLIKLVVLLSKYEDSEVLVECANSILKKFKNYRLFEILFSKPYEKSVIWNQLMVKGNVLNKFNYINAMVNEQEYLTNLIVHVHLINITEDKTILNGFVEKLDYESNKYLIGLIYYLNNDIKSIDLLSYENYLDFNNKGHHFDSKLSSFLGGTVESESDYYHNLSTLISDENDEFMNKSIELELNAIKLAPKDKDVSLYYKRVFDLSIKLHNTDKVLEALTHLKDSSAFTDYIRAFIKNVVDSRAVRSLFDIKNSGSGYSQFLNDNFKLIDTVLVAMANDEPILSSMKYYDLIYAWRINHSLKRESVEALYLFVTRFENDQYLVDDSNLKIGYLKILEYYLVILNCLKSFQNDTDRWLIKTGIQNKLVTLKDLDTEYHSYVKKLNSL